tara:strand:- start:1756 stop:2085 length:330 start_codon:yes stop_codon:yes gene_type:complete
VASATLFYCFDIYIKRINMPVPRIKYEMFADIRYDGRLVDVLDRIRAVRLVLMVHIEQDLGPNKELVKIKILTPYPANKSFEAVRQMCLGKIETLKDMSYRRSTLTKLG